MRAQVAQGSQPRPVPDLGTLRGLRSSLEYWVKEILWAQLMLLWAVGRTGTGGVRLEWLTGELIAEHARGEHHIAAAVARVARGLHLRHQTEPPEMLHGSDTDLVHTRVVLPSDAWVAVDQHVRYTAPTQVDAEREADRPRRRQ